MSDEVDAIQAAKKEQEFKQSVAVELLRRQKASSKILDFTCYTFPQYVPEPAHRLIGEKLDAVVNGEIRRLMIFAPPQHGKSEMASVRFPAYWLGRRPDHPIILCSYGSSLAESKSRQARQVVESQEYNLLFQGLGTRKDSRSISEWQINGGRGYLVAAGVSGPITGKGAMCFPAGAMVTTNIGELPIEQVVELVGKVKVLSFNHKLNKLEWRDICASKRTRSSEFVEFRTDQGIKLRCTPSHEIFTTKNGYRKAGILRRGEKVITFWEDKSSLPDLWKEEGRKNSRLDLQRMLFSDKKNKLSDRMQLVSQYLFKRKKLGSRSNRIWSKEFLLFSRMYQKSKSMLEQRKRLSRGEKLCYLWENNRLKDKNILFSGMQTKSNTECKKRKSLSYLSNNLYSKRGQSEILLQKMFKHGCVDKEFKSIKSKIQVRNRSFWPVCKDAFGDIGKRLLSVFDMSNSILSSALRVSREKKDEYDCTPYRREYFEQCARKLNNSLQSLPYETSYIGKAWETDSVFAVERLSLPIQSVYDIQVEGNNNYFVNGVLVHNCGIIDDPIKDWQEAQSQTIRDTCWEWYRTTFLTRIWEHGAIILIQTRWHEDDLAGRLLREQPGDWEVLRLPAIAETQEERDSNDEFLGLPKGQADPLGRTPGEPLCPGRYSIEALETFKRTVGPSGFSALYQGVPRPSEGNRFKRSWFLPLVDSVPYGAQRVRAWDKAASANEGDYSVGCLMALHEGTYYIENIERGRWLAGERDKRMRKVAEQDSLRYKNNVSIWVEQEPGSGGKESAQNAIKLLAGFPVQVDKVSGSKEVRAEPFASQAEYGNIKLVRAPWNNDFFNEILAFPNGTHDDIVDAVSMSFNKLALSAGTRPSLRVYGLKGGGIHSSSNKREQQFKINVCSTQELETFDFDQECLLVTIDDPDSISIISPNKCHKLIDNLALHFVDIDPNSDECKNWDEKLLPWDKTPEELIMSREQGRKLWSFLLKKRSVNPIMYIIQDNGGSDRRATSIALGICDILNYKREKTVFLLGDPEFKLDADPQNKHVYQICKSTRHTVI